MSPFAVTFAFFFLKKKDLFFNVFECFACLAVGAPSVSLVPGMTVRGHESPGNWALMSHHVHAGNQTQALWGEQMILTTEQSPPPSGFLMPPPLLIQEMESLNLCGNRGSRKKKNLLKMNDGWSSVVFATQL